MHPKLKPYLAPLIAIVLIIMAVLFIAGVFSDKQPAGEKAPLMPYQGKTVQVIRQPVTQYHAVTASVASKHKAFISPLVSAQIKTFDLLAGQRVTKGQLLAELDNSQFIAQKNAIQAELNGTNALLQQAKQQLLRANKLKLNALISEHEYEQQQTLVANLSAKKHAIEAQLIQAKNQLSYTQITAPFNGVVVERLAEAGDIAQIGQPLLTLNQQSQLHIVALAREQDAAKLKVGQALRIEVPSIGLDTQATIAEITPELDQQTHNLKIKLNAPKVSKLTAGLRARVFIPEQAKQVILINTQWVHQYGQLSMVYVLNGETPQRRYIRLGQVYGEQVEVISGLYEGDKVAFEHHPAPLN